MAELTLTVEDVSCTEAWLMLKLTNISLPTEVTLYKNNSIAQNNILCYGDTLLYIDSLLPNQTYKFLAEVQLPVHMGHNATTNELTVTTLDTTSHNFTFQSWTFGTIGSSTLYDVAIIDENNIWAVGEINVADTSINGYTTYNAVHWNGIEWELKRIPVLVNTTIFYPSMRSIFAFESNDIWFGAGIHWDDKNFTARTNSCPLLPNGEGWQVNKLWGSNSNDLYAVGNGGNIAHWNGRKWMRIESGTTLNINDIWRDFNEKTQEWEILVVAVNIFSGIDKEVILIKNTSTEILNKFGIKKTLNSLWFKPNRKYYVVGSGTYEKVNLFDPIWKGDPLDITSYFENRIRANALKDIFIVGAFGKFLHFNGISWKSYISDLGLFNGICARITVKNNFVVTVGDKGAQAKILLGRRTN